MQAKIGVDGPEQGPIIRDMVKEFVRGLCWVMKYYYDGAQIVTLQTPIILPTASKFLLISLLESCIC